MKVLNKIESLIFELPAWKFISVIFLIMLIKTGIWVNPTIGQAQEISQNPFINPFNNPDLDFLLWNWLGPYLAWVIGAKSRFAFFIFHFTFSLSFTFLYIKIIFTRFSNAIARKSLVLFCILPVSCTAYFFVGYDSITLFLLLLTLAYPRYLFLTFFAGLALGMQHFEQSFFAISSLLFSSLLSIKFVDSFFEKKYSKLFIVILLVGIISGKLILINLFNYYHINVNSGRIYWVKGHLNFLLSNFIFHFQYILWSVLGLGNLILLKYLDFGKKTIPFFITFIGLLFLLPISGDHTRVLAIITFPLIVIYFLLNEKFLNYISKKEISIIFLFWILIPWGWVWGGLPRGSVFSHDLYYILHKYFGLFHPVSFDFDWWPFY